MNLLHPLLGTKPLVQGARIEVPDSIFPEYPNILNPQDNYHVICLVDTAKFLYSETRISLDPELTFYYSIYKKGTFFKLFVSMPLLCLNGLY